MAILAHVSPPSIVFQLRNFDVPLLVIISGYFNEMSTRHIVSISDALRFLYKRFVRLSIPTWGVITAHLVFSYAFGLIPSPSLGEIARTYLFIDGIGYVWIVRIFWGAAVIAAFWALVKNRSQAVGGRLEVLLIAALGVTGEVFSRFSLSGFPALLKDTLLIPFIAYGSLALAGNLIVRAGVLKKLRLAAISLAVYLALVVVHGQPYQFSTQQWKYPPTIFYMSYALMMSSLMLCLPWERIASRLGVASLGAWIGRNSLEVFLWHIPFVEYFNRANVDWYINFIATLAGAIAMTFIHLSVSKYIKIRILEIRPKEVI